MFCSKCGQENENDAKFCRSCGNPLASNEPVVVDESKEVNNKKGKGKKKGGIVAAIVFAVILVAGAITAAAFPKIERAVLGESAYYLVQEYSTIESILDTGSIAELIQPKSFSANSELTVDSNIDEEVDGIFDFLKLTAQVNYSESKGAVGVDAALVSEENELFSLGLDYLDEKLALSTGLLDKSLLLYSGEKTDDSLAYADALKDAVKILKNLLKDRVDKENVQKSKDTFKGTEYDTVSFSFTAKEMDELIVNMLKALLESNSIKEVVDVYSDTIINFVGEYGDGMVSLEQYINEFINEIETYGLCDFDKFEIKVYYNSRGKIAAREFIVTDGTYNDKLTIESNIDSKNADIIITMDEMEISYKKTLRGNSMDVTVACELLNGATIDININDMQSKSCNGVNTICGSLNVIVGGELEVLNLSAQTNNDVYTINWNCDIPDEDINISGAITTQLSTSANVSDVSIPENSVTNSEEYFEELGEKLGEVFFNTMLGMDDSYYYDDYGYDYSDYSDYGYYGDDYDYDYYL